MAINNARMYEDLLARDQTLMQRNEDLALVNDVAASLSDSLDVDEILNQTLTRVMAYLGVEAGEIFLVEEGTNELRLALHRGEAAEAFWTMDRFQIGEGFIGIVAETGKPMVTLTPSAGYALSAPRSGGGRVSAALPVFR